VDIVDKMDVVDGVDAMNSGRQEAAVRRQRTNPSAIRQAGAAPSGGNLVMHASADGLIALLDEGAR
jgi:hypothetical protein